MTLVKSLGKGMLVFSKETAMQLSRVSLYSWALESNRYFIRVRTVSSLSSNGLTLVLGVAVELVLACTI